MPPNPSADTFGATVKACAAKLESIGGEARPDDADRQAHALVLRAFDVQAADASLLDVAVGPIATAFVAGVITEAHLAKTVADLRGSKTTAQDIADRLMIELPDGMAIGQMPLWLREAAADALERTMRQPYWQQINITTRDDIEITLRDSIEEGVSIRNAARMIRDRNGPEYDMTRATLVARTEVPNALNAGHAAGIARVQAETGRRVGKEWLSVMGSTTRETHAALDGVQTEDAEGEFSLGGYDVPWPAHDSLPASERCNCQCTVISVLTMDEISEDDLPPDDGDAVDAADPVAADAGGDGAGAADVAPVAAEVVDDGEPLSPFGKPWSRLSPDELYQLPVQTIANQHPELLDVHARVLEAAKQHEERNKEHRAEVEANEVKYREAKEYLRMTHDLRYTDAKFDALPPEAQQELGDTREKAYKQMFGAAAARDGFAVKEAAILKQSRVEFLKVAGVTAEDRLSISPELSKGLKPREQITDVNDPQYGKIMANKDGARRISTGKFSKEYKANIKEGVAFVEQLSTKIVDGSTAQDARTHEIERVTFHAGGKGLRAFAIPVESDHHREGNSRRGVFGDPKCETRTVVHEMGHVIDGARQGLGQGARRSVEFAKYRTADTPEHQLNARYPSYNYRSSERGNEDHFIAAFDPNWHEGKVYDHGPSYPKEEEEMRMRASYTGKPYGTFATEIVSMGLEQMYVDPFRFAARDPEWFRFTLGMLRGKYDRP